jgi:hypothetical protein
MNKFIKWIVLIFSSQKREEKKAREREKALAEATLEDRQNVQRSIVRRAKLWNVVVEFSEDGWLTKESRERVAAHCVLEGEDLIIGWEFHFGAGDKFWSEKQWAQALESFFPDRKSMESRTRGVDDVFGRPGLIIKLLELYVRHPELLSPFLLELTKNAIGMARRGELGQAGQLVMNVLPQLEVSKGV